jgi:hypothetical protein
MRKAVVDEATGLVINVIELEEDSDWPCPDGCCIKDAELCSIGWTWNDVEFVAPTEILPDRIEVLMESPKSTWDSDGNEIPKTSKELSDEKSELLTLLQSKILDEATPLSNEEMNIMLRLERT